MTNGTRGAVASIGCLALAGSLLLAAPATRPVKTTWTAQEALPFTCAQAWVASRKSYPGLLAIVKTLARVSLANRELTFPNTREAGLEAGKGIADDCKADPNNLLFAIVDRHVRRVALAAAAAR